jgi:hypothetical protein
MKVVEVAEESVEERPPVNVPGMEGGKSGTRVGGATVEQAAARDNENSGK